MWHIIKKETQIETELKIAKRKTEILLSWSIVRLIALVQSARPLCNIQALQQSFEKKKKGKKERIIIYIRKNF